MIACFSVFLSAGCNSEFYILLDKDQYLNEIIFSTLYTAASSTVYWSEQTGGIKKTSSKGTGETTLLNTSPGIPLDIALYVPGKKIYWAEDTGTAFQIKYANLDGTGETTFLTDTYSPDHGPSDIAIDTRAAIIYWNRYQNMSGHNDIWRVNLSSVNPAVDAIKRVNQIPNLYTFCITLDTVGREIYITANTYWDITSVFGSGQSGSMYIAKMDILNTYLPYQINASGPANPSVPLRGIAVDGLGGHVYYASNTVAGVAIIRTGLLFQDPIVWITALGFDVDKLALDLRERKIYWTSRINNSIYRATINRPESGIERFRQLTATPTGIAVSH